MLCFSVYFYINDRASSSDSAAYVMSWSSYTPYLFIHVDTEDVGSGWKLFSALGSEKQAGPGPPTGLLVRPSAFQCTLCACIIFNSSLYNRQRCPSCRRASCVWPSLRWLWFPSRPDGSAEWAAVCGRGAAARRRWPMSLQDGPSLTFWLARRCSCAPPRNLNF